MSHVVLLKSTIAHLGGLEKYTLRLARAFARKSAKVTLLTTGTSPQEEAFITESFHFSSRLSFKKILEFDEQCQSFIRKHNPDIIFGLDRNRFQTHIRAGNGVHASYLKSRKQVEGFLKACSFSFNPLHRILLSLEKAAFEDPRLQVIFTNSHMVKNQILEHYHTDPSKIQVVHNGVEWSAMEKPFAEAFFQKKAILKSLKLDPSVFHFLFIGNNFKRKGLDPLLKALSILNETHFHLSIVGNDKNLSNYQRQVHRLGLSQNVTFWGPRRDILPFYQMADCLVIPSFYDPFANVTVEALAMGLFVISSRTNGGHEILTSENGAVVSDLTDIDSLLHELKAALKRPKTEDSASHIRSSIAYLDFPNQLNKIIDLCI